jgi:BON domain
MRPSCVRNILGAILATSACWANPISADEVRAPAIGVPATIVVTGEKPAADEQVRTQVETALHSDPYFYDGHVTVTVKDGVVHLQGVVFDAWDLRTARRISKKIAGAKRVVNELEICSCDGGGGA